MLDNRFGPIGPKCDEITLSDVGVIILKKVDGKKVTGGSHFESIIFRADCILILINYYDVRLL